MTKNTIKIPQTASTIRIILTEIPRTASIISIFRGFRALWTLEYTFSQNGPHHRFQREKLLYWSNLAHQDHQNVFSSVLSSHPLLVSDITARDVTRVGETIAYSRLRRDLDDFGRSRLLVLVLQQQLA